jgi:hypothetical protein
MRASGRVFALAGMLGVFASACGIKSTVNWEQENGTCPANPSLTVDGGMLNSGLCGSADDCNATCCACNNDAGQFWAAACNENYCVDPCQAGQGPGGACH